MVDALKGIVKAMHLFSVSGLMIATRDLGYVLGEHREGVRLVPVIRRGSIQRYSYTTPYPGALDWFSGYMIAEIVC